MVKLASCKECGCLALRNAKTLELVGAGDSYRQGGSIPTESNRYVFEEIPVCAANAFNFAFATPTKETAYSMIRGEWCCDHFIPWQPALSPKEHLEMKQLQEQREYNRQMLESDRLWRESQAKAEREWKEQDRKDRAIEAEKVERRYQDDRRDASRRFWLGFIGAILATVIAQVVIWLILPTESKPSNAPAAAEP